MPVVDLIIAALTLAIGAWGYRHGVMTKPLVLVGFLGGTLLGSWVAPPVLGGVLPARGGYTAYAVLASTAQRALQRAEGPVDTGACEEDG